MKNATSLILLLSIGMLVMQTVSATVTIDSISPNTALTGEVLNGIELTGSDFSSLVNPVVILAGLQVNSPVVNSDTSITFDIDFNGITPGIYSLQVINDSGFGTEYDLSDSFTVTSIITPTPTPTSVPLHLTSIHPDTAPNTGRSTVQVFGSGFDANQPHLQLNLGGGLTWDSISNYSYQSDEEFYVDLDLTGAPEGVYPVEIYNPVNRDINDSLWNAFTVANISEFNPAPTPTSHSGVGLYASTVSETGITFQWNTGYVVDVYVDGQKTTTNYTDNHWIVSRASSSEAHQIRLVNSTNQTDLEKLAVSTLTPEWFIVVMISILLVLCIFIFVLKDQSILVLIVGGIMASVGIYTGVISNGYGGLMVIPYLFVILAGGFILYALWNIIIEKTQWG